MEKWVHVKDLEAFRGWKDELLVKMEALQMNELQEEER